MKLTKKQFVILMILIHMKLSIFGQIISTNEIVFNDDFKMIVNDKEFRISENGVVTYKEFKAELFSPKEIGWYEAGHYIGIIHNDFLVADMSVEGDYGGMRFTMFANYKNNKIIYLRNISDRPTGLKGVIGKDNNLIFIYSREAICYDLKSEEISWHTIWSDGSTNSQLKQSLKAFKADEDLIYVTLRSNKLIKFDYKTGILK